MSTNPGDYLHFKALVPLHHIPIGGKQWRYYDFGPKSVQPLVCLPGTAGTLDVFYKQILSLSMKGYRVIAADAPPLYSHQEWISSFEKFLDAIGVYHIHIYGTSLGGFLAQLFAQYRPRRVKSLILCNTFVDTRCFSAAVSWSSMINWTPEFLLKRYILSGIRDGPQEPLIADSIDFVVNQLETLSREELASRLTLNTQVAAIGQIMVPDSCITIMDTNDYSAVPQALKDEVGARYPAARRAFLKSGGDFPFLSRPDEVNLHLRLHLRHVGVEGYADIRGMSKGSGGDSASGEEPIDEEEDDEEPFSRQRRSIGRRQLVDKPTPSRKSLHESEGGCSHIGGSTTSFPPRVSADLALGFSHRHQSLLLWPLLQTIFRSHPPHRMSQILLYGLILIDFVLASLPSLYTLRELHYYLHADALLPRNRFRTLSLSFS